jgi:hypothetical protein
MAYYVTKTMASIVSEALQLLNKVEGQDEPDNVDMQRGAKALQMMLEEWQAQGLTMWMRRRGELFISEGIADYDMVDTGDNVIELLFVSLVETDDDEEAESTISIISRQDYLDMPDKLTQGRPVMAWLSYNEDDTATITFWPTPDDDYKIKVDYKTRFTNASVTTTEIEIPRYWLKAVIWCLARDLAIPYGVVGSPAGMAIAAEAQSLYNTAAAFDEIQQGGGEIRFAPGC